MGKSTHRSSAAQLLALVLTLSLGGGCVGGLAARYVRYDYFAAPAENDAWSRKIQMWQARERAERDTDAGRSPASVSGSPADAAGAGAPRGDLRAKYDDFRNERRRELARELAEWIQSEAREHYVADGPIDHWATFDETFRSNGDDCDGLELLVFNMLRELGFADDEVYRAIVYRRSDGQHHMVTLWFEGSDPWVIDPTGAMTSGMPRMSEVPGWVPLKVFNEQRDFTVNLGTDTGRSVAQN